MRFLLGHGIDHPLSFQDQGCGTMRNFTIDSPFDQWEINCKASVYVSGTR